MKGVLILSLILCISQADAMVVTVGNTSDCDFNVSSGQTFQQAVSSSGTTEVRLTIQQIFGGRININNPIKITGGFDDCTSAAANTPSSDPSNKTVVSGFAGDRVFDIFNCSLGEVTLEKLHIMDGSAELLGVPRGGGINVVNNACNINVINSILSNNTARTGAGIFLIGAGDLFIQDTFFENNRTITNIGPGGGIYSEAAVTVVGNSGFRDNAAQKGGAIHIENSTLTVVGGDDLPNVGFFNNSAVGTDGGAISLVGSTATLTGNTSTIDNIVYGNQIAPLKFDGNEANQFGGGVMANASSLIVRDVYFSNNVAQSGPTTIDGAGGAIAFDADFFSQQLSIEADPENCWRQQGCNVFIGNTSHNGGAISANKRTLGDSATVNIKHSFFQQNAATNGTSVLIRERVNAIVENSIIYEDAPNTSPRINGSIFFNVNAVLNVLYTNIIENNADNVFFTDAATATTNVYNSIVYNDAVTSINNTSTSYDFDCVITDRQGPQFIDISTQDYNDLFVDTASLNFKLNRTAEAVDLCADATSISVSTDIQGISRGYDDPDVPNVSGAFDAGANELDELIFKTGFDVASINLLTNME